MPIILLTPGFDNISILGPRNLSILEVTLDGESQTFYKDCQHWKIEAQPLGRLNVVTNKSTHEFFLC